jgi:hypothetical protein
LDSKRLQTLESLATSFLFGKNLHPLLAFLIHSTNFFDFHSFPQLFFKNVNGPIHPWASNPIYTQKLLPKFFLALDVGRA